MILLRRLHDTTTSLSNSTNRVQTFRNGDGRRPEAETPGCPILHVSYGWSAYCSNITTAEACFLRPFPSCTGFPGLRWTGAPQGCAGQPGGPGMTAPLERQAIQGMPGALAVSRGLVS